MPSLRARLNKQPPPLRHMPGYYLLAYDEQIAAPPSGKAVLYRFGDDEVWIPASQSKVVQHGPEPALYVRQWLVRKNGLVDYIDGRG